MLVRANALDKVTEALDQNTAGEHVAQRCDVLAVAIGLIKGLGEAVGHQKCKVSVLAAQSGIGVGVAVDGVYALDIFGDDVAVGVHAEGAHLVAVLLGAVDELGFVDNVGDVLKNGRRKLDAHADIDLIVYELNAQFAALLGEPLRAASAGRYDKVAALYVLALPERKRVALAVAVYAAHLGAEAVFYYLAQILVHILKDAQVVFGAQMLDLCLKQVQVIF